jgi:hypothetical protein
MIHKIHSGNEVLDRLQDQYAAELNPALKTVAAQEQVTTARVSPVAMQADVSLLLVCLGPSTPPMVTLPGSPRKGRQYTIKDAKGDAATNPITVLPVVGTIDGFASIAIDLNFGAVTVVWDGQQWFTL